MKKMMTALAALCVAGLAGAVTIDWNSGTTAAVDMEAGKSYELTAKITLGEGVSVDSDTYLLTYGNGNATSNAQDPGGILLYGGGGGIGFKTIGTWKGGENGSKACIWSNRVAGTNAAGDYTVTVRFEANGTEGWDVVFKINGEEVTFNTTGHTATASETVASMLNEGKLNLTLGSASGVTMGAVTFVGVVPEPTALALLALGAAGLALRRKAA